MNISGLNLKNLNGLKSLSHLTELIAADNQFVDSNCIVPTIAQLQRLKSATFAECPAYKNDIYYRNKIILASKTLGLLYLASFSSIFFPEVISIFKFVVAFRITG